VQLRPADLQAIGVSVAEVVQALGQQNLAAPVGRINGELDERAIRLKGRLDTPADFLSGGEQQMVAVARALSGHVRVLLLDEPFEGLAPAVVEELFEAFDRLRQELSIVIVEHNLDLVLALADQAYVLERGSVVHHGPAAALRDDLQLRRRVLWM